MPLEHNLDKILDMFAGELINIIDKSEAELKFGNFIIGKLFDYLSSDTLKKEVEQYIQENPETGQIAFEYSMLIEDLKKEYKELTQNSKMNSL